MKTKLTVAIALAGATLAAMPALAATYADNFRFEFGASTSAPLIDDYKYRGDFIHHRDYYVTPGYTDPYQNTYCVETRVPDEEGRMVRRITCSGRSGSGIPLR